VVRVLLLAGLLLCVSPSSSTAQDLVSRLKQARYLAAAHAFIQQQGERRPIRPVQRLPRVESLNYRIWNPPFGEVQLDLGDPLSVRPFREARVQYIPPDRRLLHHALFSLIPWSYLGTERVLPLDTTHTWRIRSALEAAYGPPTRTVVDLAGVPLSFDNAFQFEYWFVVNDSIPVYLSDTGGPYDRGILFAVPAPYRERTLDVRDALMASVMESGILAPFADYFFEPETRRWYLAEFTGRRTRIRAISTPDLRAGPPATPADER